MLLQQIEFGELTCLQGVELQWGSHVPCWWMECDNIRNLPGQFHRGRKWDRIDNMKNSEHPPLGVFQPRTLIIDCILPSECAPLPLSPVLQWPWRCCRLPDQHLLNLHAYISWHSLVALRGRKCEHKGFSIYIYIYIEREREIEGQRGFWQNRGA